MIVGFAGTRQGPTPAQHKSMDWFLSKLSMSRFVHGGAPHCDTMAHYIVRWAHRDTPIDVYPADRGCSFMFAPGAVPMKLTTVHKQAPPLERNRAIVQLIHGLVAVPRTDEEGDSGTWATVRYAMEIGCPVYVIRQDGRIVRYEV